MFQQIRATHPYLVIFAIASTLVPSVFAKKTPFSEAFKDGAYIQNSTRSDHSTETAWINCYFIFGCQSTKGTNSYVTHDVLVSAGDWKLYDVCRVIAGLYNHCGEPTDLSKVSLRGNDSSVLVTETRREHLTFVTGQMSESTPGDSIFEIVSAYNFKTDEVWGRDTADHWRGLLLELDIDDELKKLSLSDQLAWTAKMNTLKSSNLDTVANLRLLLSEIRSAGDATAR